MRDFCSGVTRAKMVVFGSSATRAASSSFSSSCPVTTVPGSRPTSPQRCAATWPLSPVTILTVISSRASRASESLDAGLDRVGEAEESLEREVVLVVFAEVVAGERAARDGDDARARGEEPVEDRLCLGGHGRAAGEDGFRGALGDQQPSLLRVDEDRGQLPLVVEGQAVERRRDVVAVGGLRRGPERAVELVAGLVAAGQAEHADVVVRLARAVERLRERDLTLGQGAGLVREQHLDVAEILDRDQALDDHALLGQPAGARRQADGDDRGQ